MTLPTDDEDDLGSAESYGEFLQDAVSSLDGLWVEHSGCDLSKDELQQLKDVLDEFFQPRR